MMEKGTPAAEFSMSGTLGDAFTVFCKLAGYHNRTGKKIKLYRYSQNLEFDKSISEFFSIIPYIEYMIPSFPIQWSSDMIKDCKNMIAPHVSTVWNGKNGPFFPDDPMGMDFESYPEINTAKLEINDQKFKVGIQLQTGKERGNFKGFDLSWISSIKKTLGDKDYSLYLLGTSARYSVEKVRRFCKENDIVDMVGRTDVPIWLAYIKSMDFFITPEGFSAFFAMSQKVRSLVFYNDYQILGRVPPTWRRGNIIMSAGQEVFINRVLNAICRILLSRNHLFKPILPSQVFSLIYAEKVYL